jgi:hypothetical protein
MIGYRAPDLPETPPSEVNIRISGDITANEVSVRLKTFSG